MALEGKARDLPGVGKTIEEKIVQIVQDGEIEALRTRRERVPPELISFLRIPGLGPKTVRRIWQELGITTVEELRTAAAEQRLRTLAGLGAKTEENVLQALAREEPPAAPDRTLLGRALPAFAGLIAELREQAERRPDLRGGQRAPPARERARHRPDRHLHRSSSPSRPGSSRTRRWPRSRPTARPRRPWSGRTASASTCGSCRPRASATCSSTSRARKTTTSRSARRRCARASPSRSTASRSWRRTRSSPPRTRRTSTGASATTSSRPSCARTSASSRRRGDGELPELVEVDDLRGDLHTHSTWSATPTTRSRRWRAPRSSEATSTSPPPTTRTTSATSRFAAQAEEIAALNERLAPFRILRGVEVNIALDGTVDMSDEDLAACDWVIASLHRAFDRDPTERILAAMEHPRVHCIGHPTARKIGRRAGAELDLDRVIGKALETGTFLEINSQPDRLDLRDVHARAAREAGLRLAITSDGHRTPELANVEYGVAQARRAWFTRDDVLNTRPWAEVQALLRGRRSARGDALPGGRGHGARLGGGLSRARGRPPGAGAGRAGRDSLPAAGVGPRGGRAVQRRPRGPGPRPPRRHHPLAEPALPGVLRHDRLGAGHPRRAAGRDDERRRLRLAHITGAHRARGGRARLARGAARAPARVARPYRGHRVAATIAVLAAARTRVPAAASSSARSRRTRRPPGRSGCSGSSSARRPVDDEFRLRPMRSARRRLRRRRHRRHDVVHRRRPGPRDRRRVRGVRRVAARGRRLRGRGLDLPGVRVVPRRGRARRLGRRERPQVAVHADGLLVPLDEAARRPPPRLRRAAGVRAHRGARGGQPQRLRARVRDAGSAR